MCELVVPKREKALLWGQIWHDYGEPREGIVGDIYRRACREYHYMVKYINNNEDTSCKQRMMEYIVVSVCEDNYQSRSRMNWRDPEFDQLEPKPWAQVEKCKNSIAKTKTDI